MKRIVLALAAVTAMSGCTLVNEAYLLDQEFGMATRSTLENQIAYPDYRFAGVTPAGLEGVNAEGLMDVYNKSFAEPPAKEVKVFDLGLAGGAID